MSTPSLKRTQEKAQREVCEEETSNKKSNHTKDVKEDQPDDSNQPKSLLTLENKAGDLFTTSPRISLAHCISQDCAMGKGIAVLFKRKFGRVDQLKAQNKQTGEVAILKDQTRFIYYLITKKKYWNKPTYQSLTDSLLQMRTHMIEHRVTELAMPRIGCGLDMLEWDRVYNIIKEVFQQVQTPTKITIYTFN